jgi:hypothetical protein
LVPQCASESKHVPVVDKSEKPFMPMKAMRVEPFTELTHISPTSSWPDGITYARTKSMPDVRR